MSVVEWVNSEVGSGYGRPGGFPLTHLINKQWYSNRPSATCKLYEAPDSILSTTHIYSQQYVFIKRELFPN